ncbi:G_PROTEIN_RECEP_F3_4 domain-containing protein, partial [Podarcis lilfordi]
ISYGSSDEVLRSKTLSPFFYWTVPNEGLQTLGITKLVLHFGWTWVGLIASCNDQGETFVLNLKKEFVQKGVCIEFTEMLPKMLDNTMHVKNKIIKSSSSIIVVYGDTDFLIWVKITIESSAVSGKVLIITSQWDFLSSVSYLHMGFSSFSGTLSFALHKHEIVGFRHFLQNITLSKYPDDVFLPHFWGAAFSCFIPSLDSGSMFWQLCTGNERIKDLPKYKFDLQTLDLSYNIYKAVYAIAKSLHEMYSSRYITTKLENRSRPKMHKIKPWK